MLNHGINFTDTETVKAAFLDKTHRWELEGNVIRSIEDYLDDIIYVKDIFSDEDWAVPVIIDLRIIKDAADKGYAELKQVLDKTF